MGSGKSSRRVYRLADRFATPRTSATSARPARRGGVPIRRKPRAVAGGLSGDSYNGATVAILERDQAEGQMLLNSFDAYLRRRGRAASTRRAGADREGQAEPDRALRTGGERRLGRELRVRPYRGKGQVQTRIHHVLVTQRECRAHRRGSVRAGRLPRVAANECEARASKTRCTAGLPVRADTLVCSATRTLIPAPGVAQSQDSAKSRPTLWRVML